jgi:iron(III) transport system permease protein
MLLLPWAREGRELLTFSPGTTGLALLSGSPLVAAAVGSAVATVVIGLVPRGEAQRGRAALFTGIVGAALVVAYLVLSARPLGPGPLVGVLGFLAVLGTGLALSGTFRADAFIVTCILWAAAFVLVFILYPLWSVLQAAVVINGRLSLAAAVNTLHSPVFFLLNRPATPYNETVIAAVIGLSAGLLLTGGLLVAGRGWRAIGWGAASAAGAWALAALSLGSGALRNSLLLALIVGVVSTTLGFLFALLRQRSRLRTRRLLGPFSILPIITPPFILGLAMIYMFGRRGFVTHQVLGLSTNVFFGPIGVAFAQILASTPIAYLVLEGVVQAMDVALEEAAETLGASRWHILRTVIWPLARPGIANALLLVAIESLADFGNPIIVGGGAPFLATEIFFAIIGRYDPHEAAVYGVVLLTITLTIFLIQQGWISRRVYVTITGRPSSAAPRSLPPTLDYAVSGLFLIWVALVVLLYGSVFVSSVTKLWGEDNTLTLLHLRGLSPTGWRVLWTTVRLAALASVPSAIVGFLIGYLVTRVDFPGRRALEYSAMLSFAVPGTVMGIGYILAFNNGILLLTGTELIIIMAFIFRNMPVGIRAGVAAIHQVDRSLEEASTLLRAGSATTLRRIVMPLVRPALFSGLVFAFVRAMTAVSQVIFLITPASNLATTQILSYVEYGSQGRGSALASLLTASLIVVIVPLYAVSRRLSAGATEQMARVRPD